MVRRLLCRGARRPARRRCVRDVQIERCVWTGHVEQLEGAIRLLRRILFNFTLPYPDLIVLSQQSRGVSLPGAEPHPDLASLSRRFLELGFTTAQAVTLREIRRRYIDSRELQRLSQLEMLDEVEELELVLDHYAISWGVKFPEGWAREGGAGAGAWGLVAKKQVENDEDVDDDHGL